MLVSHSEKVVFVGNRRCGTTSILNYLRKHISMVREEFPENRGEPTGMHDWRTIEGYYTFMVMRNPLYRTLSLWHWARNYPTYHGFSDMTDAEYREIHDKFETFVDWCISTDDQLAMAQTEMHDLVTVNYRGGHIDRILLFDKLEEHFSKLPFVKEGTKLQRLGLVTNSDRPEPFFDNPHLVGKILDWCHNDLESHYVLLME